MREYFVPKKKLYENSGKKMREYFIPENIGRKTWYEMFEYFLPVQLSAEIGGKKCLSIFTSHKTKRE